MKKIFLLFYILSISSLCFGQIFPDSLAREDFKYRVKQLDEFMARFNGEEWLELNVPDSLKQNANLLYLFNRDLFTTNKDSMEQVADHFIHTVIDNKVTLHFDDKDWFAEVLCNCTYKDKKEQVTLYLKPEKIEEYMYRWVIIGAKGEILKLTPPKRNHGLDILPNNHEVAFMALPRIESLGSSYILNYSQFEYEPDQLSVFYALVYSGTLKIETTENIIYHFLKVPDYIFNVERFMRKGNNSGWLISRLVRTEEQEKTNYLNQCLSN